MANYKKEQQYRIQLSDSQNRIEALQSAVRKKEEKEDRRQTLLDMYDDRHTLEEGYSREYQYISVARVDPPDAQNQRLLTRLADISENGEIMSFYPNFNEYRYFGNRDRLFYKDGPSQEGQVAVWNWNALRNARNPDTDYVESSFNRVLSPAEVIILKDTPTIQTALSGLIKGLKLDFPCRSGTERKLFAFRQPDGLYQCLLVRQNQLEMSEDDNRIRLKKEVDSLPCYCFDSNQFLRLPDDRYYFRRITLGKPDALINTRSDREVVKDIVLSKCTWNAFKERSISRGDWQKYRSFLEMLDMKSLTEAVEEKCMCSQDEAKKLIAEFLEIAGNYIDGDTVEDRILRGIVLNDPQIRQQSMDLLEETWQAKNKDRIQQAQAQYDEIHDKAVLEEEHVLQLKAERQAFEEALSQKEKMAEEVERRVNDRIRRAQENAASFIADMAFQPQNRVEAVAAAQSDGTQYAYRPGIPLQSKHLETIYSWQELLDELQYELRKAGVGEKYAEPMAAWLYAAYLRRIPIMLIGPNGSEIVDAFSAVLSGARAGTLDLAATADRKIVSDCMNGDDTIVKVLDPFNHAWINSLPSFIGVHRKYFCAVHPFTEDIAIEPASVWAYMLPLYTDCLIEKAPNRNISGCHRHPEFEDYVRPGKQGKFHEALLGNMKTPKLVKNRLNELMTDLHAMVPGDQTDNDVLFGLLPYSRAVMRTKALQDALEGAETGKLHVSNGLASTISEIFEGE